MTRRALLHNMLLGFLLLSCLLLTACGYRFTGAPDSRISGDSSLWVSFIKIEIDSPSAQTVLRRSILEEGHVLRGLQPAGSEESSDLRVTGQLRSYTTRGISYSATDQIRDYLLTVDVELAVSRKGEQVPFWKGIIQGRQAFPANSDLSIQRASEEVALNSAARMVAHKLFSTLEQGY